ncbi:MAG: hypothetical protein R3C68_04540 [Myxococcota bacterium]
MSDSFFKESPEGDSRKRARTTLRMQRPTKKLGTFLGVFTPTLLTILGVIMYLRLVGWSVKWASCGPC